MAVTELVSAEADGAAGSGASSSHAAYVRSGLQAHRLPLVAASALAPQSNPHGRGDTAGNATTSSTPWPFSSTSVADPYTGATTAATSRPMLHRNAITVKTNARRPWEEGIRVTPTAYSRPTNTHTATGSWRSPDRCRPHARAMSTRGRCHRREAKFCWPRVSCGVVDGGGSQSCRCRSRLAANVSGGVDDHMQKCADR
jgi:hypothetical protein